MRRESWFAKRFTTSVLQLANVIDINKIAVSSQLGRNLKPYKIPRVNCFKSLSGEWLGVNEIGISTNQQSNYGITGEDVLENYYDKIRYSKTTYFLSCKYSKGYYILRLHIIE